MSYKIGTFFNLIFFIFVLTSITCFELSEYGDTQENNYNLESEDPPETRFSLNEEDGALGHKIIIKITNITSPTPCSIWIKWRMKRNPNKFVISWTSDDTSSGSDDNVGNKRRNYTISGLDASTDYQITVTAISKSKNFSDAASNSTLEGSPPNITNLVAVDITSTKIHLTWDHEASPCPIKEYIIRWNTRPFWDEGKTSSSQASSITPYYTMTNLVPYSNISISVTATASDDNKGSAMSIYCETPQGAPGQPENFAAIPQSDSEIHLNWEEPPDKNGILGPYLITWEAPDVSGTKGYNETNNTYIDIANLRACGNYTFNVSASTTIEAYGFPTSTYNITLPEIPPSLTNLTVSDVESHSMNLSWARPDTLCPILNYTLYGIGDVLWNSTNVTVQEVIEDDVVTYVVDNLVPYSDYTFCLTPSTEVGSANETCTRSITAEDLPTEPTNLAANALNSSLLYIGWQQPDALNGEILTYTVTVSANGTKYSKDVNGNDRSTTVEGLNECINYMVSVAASTSAGKGPEAISNATMDSAKPPAPNNLNCYVISSTVIELSWDKSATTCPVFSYIVTANGTTLWDGNEAFSSVNTTSTTATLSELVPYTRYEVEVFTITSGGSGPSAVCNVTTDEGAPGSPIIIERNEKQTVSSLQISWMASNITNGVMKGFNVTWETGCLYELYVNDSTNVYTVQLTNMGSNTDYNVSVFGENGYGYGEPAFAIRTTKKSPLPVILGVLIPLIIIALIVAVYLNRSKFNYKNSRGTTNPLRGSDSNMEKMTCSVVPINDLKSYVDNLQNGTSLIREFESISAMKPKGFSTSVAEHPQNMTKNRYANILPYNEHRVVLKNSPADYINASYVSSFKASKYFIAAQGPTNDTIEDFWQLIWQEHVDVIVMLTSCIENGRDKCSLYWPRAMESAMNVGSYEIHSINEEATVLFSARIFEVSNKKENVKRIVNHYHYTSWPDFGVPLNDEDLLKFLRSIKKNLNSNRSTNKMLVHCSAGVGRTGTFIGLWNLIEQVDSGIESISVMKEVTQMRRQRMTMVQSQDQYLYLYKSIAAYCENRKRWQVSKDSSRNNESLDRRQPRGGTADEPPAQYSNPGFEAETDQSFVGNLI